MAEVTSILATAAAYDTYQQQQNQNRRIQQQKKNKLERQKQHTLATNRARQYASGIGGRSAENIRDDVAIAMTMQSAMWRGRVITP